MARQARIAIVGYGIAGIAAAILLRRLGHEVTHFERSPSGGSGGSGLLLHGAGLAVLDCLGLQSALRARAAPVATIQAVTSGGRKVMDLRYDELAAENHALGIQRAALFEAMRDADSHADRLRTAHVVAVDAEAGYLFERDQGRLGPFDLIVAADGARSIIRSGVPALVRRDRPYPWAALVCLVDDLDGAGGDRVFQCFSGTRHVAIWPVGTLNGGAPRRINVSVNVPISDAQKLQQVDHWKRYVAAISPRIGALLTQPLSETRLLPYTYRDVELRRYFMGRVVLLGDAAHSMSPQLGQGASMALLDSLALATALENRNIPAALVEYDRQRRGCVVAYQRISRWATPAFQSESRLLAALRDWSFHPLSGLSGIRGVMLKVINGERLGVRRA
jgi:2-polyprenyl-6-methoxyphenol hydroxylase-like FAD-dependent oxidoreductase